MSLAEALSGLCPGPAQDASDTDLDLALHPCDGPPIICHEALLRSRCPELPPTIDGRVEVCEDTAVLIALLQWIYCERLDKDRIASSDADLGTRVVRLSYRWGLRDAHALYERVTGCKRVVRSAGTLATDLLRAYEGGTLTGRFQFCGDGMVSRGHGHQRAQLRGGWCALLRARSGYFRAMLSGNWAESCNREADHVMVRVQWPQEQLARLLCFLHGGIFVRNISDLQTAVDCSTFFDVPSLLVHAADWVTDNLKIDNAPALWCFVHAEPAFQQEDGDDALNVDAACFDFHIRNFSLLAQPLDGEEGAKVPLHGLSVPLMHRLLSSGLVGVSTRALLEIVAAFVRVKCGLKADEEGDENNVVYESLFARLRPPLVLFNRQERQRLCGGVELLGARDVV